MSSSKQSSIFTTGALPTCLFLPQNGGHMAMGDFVSENSPPMMRERSSAMDLVKATFKGVDGPQRPTALGVGSTMPNTVNKVHDDCGGSQGDSLPSTPEEDMDSQSGEEEVLKSDTRQHIYTFLVESTAITKWKPDPVQATMRRVVDGVLEKHQYAYNGMITKLELDGRGADMSFVKSVAENLFADGTTNWGRIASLLAFGAAVSQYLKARGQERCVKLVAQEISSYLLSDQRDWLAKNNSWDGFVEFFRVADPETTVRNTLMVFAGFAGIGATIALLIR
ncbi:hypothetical protein NHX12_000939 [Muraenolepis orangiensis]|uniref:Bcl-2 Bcl-2 homology region 1-3 domain-containing protein n=1 Tax=Muraenolepis orangiensis TaxID=630683 RepID=A0A9Q0DZ16_9TELE|nr:hypothetical protein NHX12_000939 [Muraenolepis orangiensis]